MWYLYVQAIRYAGIIVKLYRNTDTGDWELIYTCDLGGCENMMTLIAMWRETLAAIAFIITYPLDIVVRCMWKTCTTHNNMYAKTCFCLSIKLHVEKKGWFERFWKIVAV